MSPETPAPRPLTGAEIERFVRDGFVRVDRAFSRATADAARAILWRETGCDPDEPRTWTRPVVRLGCFPGPPFSTASDSPTLRAAFDALVGPGRWLSCLNVGTFPVRFPSPVDPGDAGWHIDVSFGTEDPDFMAWRANVRSRGRALLLLLLFSDVGEDDAPTRLRVGSHRAIARTLAPAGEAGMTLRALMDDDFGGTSDWPEALATGPAGTAYLCHPFLVHSAQRHRGTRPRFMAQPPLLPRVELDPMRRDGMLSPVEDAIRRALDGD